jgi:hypothetical protein
MRNIRMILVWSFAVTALIILFTVVQMLLYPEWEPSGSRVPPWLVVPILFLILAAVFALAWWTAITKKVSARKWGIAASSIYILPVLFIIVFDFLIRHGRRSAYSSLLCCSLTLLFVLGATGVIVFWRQPCESPGSAAVDR